MINNFFKNTKQVNFIYSQSRKLHTLKKLKANSALTSQQQYSQMLQFSQRSFYAKRSMEFDPQVNYYKTLGLNESASTQEIIN